MAVETLIIYSRRPLERIQVVLHQSTTTSSHAQFTLVSFALLVTSHLMQVFTLTSTSFFPALPESVKYFYIICTALLNLASSSPIQSFTDHLASITRPPMEISVPPGIGLTNTALTGPGSLAAAGSNAMRRSSREALARSILPLL